MNDLATIQRKIYEIRGQKVILDCDLAAPEDFMFQLTKDEWKTISSQFVTTSENEVLRSQFVTIERRGRHTKYLPYAFTEHGVIMLASLLRSEIATSIT